MRQGLWLSLVPLVLAGCGDTPLEQTVFGAGAGLGTAAILDTNLAVGAAIGAAGNLIYCQTHPGRC